MWGYGWRAENILCGDGFPFLLVRPHPLSHLAGLVYAAFECPVLENEHTVKQTNAIPHSLVSKYLLHVYCVCVPMSPSQRPFMTARSKVRFGETRV